MEQTVTIPRAEYEALRKKAQQLDTWIDEEELTPQELRDAKEAAGGSFSTIAAFRKRHPTLR